MKILQFAFFDEDSEYLPRCYTTDNCVVYSGSHDANCTESRHKTLDTATKRRFDRECPRGSGYGRTYDVILMALTSRANLAVIPMQDYLTLRDEEGRMNTPSVAEGNWTWRLSPRYRTKTLTARVKAMTEQSGRGTK